MRCESVSPFVQEVFLEVLSKVLKPNVVECALVKYTTWLVISKEVKIAVDSIISRT